MKCVVVSLMLCAICGISCGSDHSDENKRQLIDSLEREYSTQLMDIQLDTNGQQDPQAVNKVIAIVDRLMQLSPEGMMKYKMWKVGLLMTDGRYKEAREILLDGHLCNLIIPQTIFPDFEKLTMLKFDALIAQQAGDSITVDKALNEMNGLLRTTILSPQFNLKKVCQSLNSSQPDNDCMMKAMFLNYWISTLYSIGGNELVDLEMKKVFDDLGMNYEQDQNFGPEITREGVLTPTIIG